MLLGVSESYLRQITKDSAEFTCGTVRVTTIVGHSR